MIVLFNPRSTKPERRRHPFSILALAAVFPEDETAIVDGNVDPDPIGTMLAFARRGGVELFGFSVMPGPQLPRAVEAAKALRRDFPSIPIVWGGFFPSLYPEACLRAPYVDFLIRGQGERTFVELVRALREGGGDERFAPIAGLTWKERPSGRTVPREHGVAEPSAPTAGSSRGRLHGIVCDP